ncbi:hypothetical protein L6386_05420, partial [bacterium]|nr:hypothetical protein [bacterium]MCG2677980.1 hypothetical protein [bacterium]
EELRKREEEQRRIAIEASRKVQETRQARETEEKRLKLRMVELEKAKKVPEKKVSAPPPVFKKEEPVPPPTTTPRILFLKIAIAITLILINILIWKALIFR